MNPETQDPNNISVVLKEVGKTIKTVGVERLMDILSHARQNPIVFTEAQFVYAKKIIETVCEEFQITVDDLYSAQRKNNRRNAIGICAYLFEKYAKIDNANSAYILKKPDDSISTYKKEMTCLNEKHPFDKVIIEKIAKIELKLKSEING
jgi:hypothetical protein